MTNRVVAALGALTLWLTVGATGALGAVTVGAGAWCWFASPQAILAGSPTVTGYVAPNGDVMAVAIAGGKVAERYVLHAGLQEDDHDTPTFYERPDGRIIAFYSRHAGTGGHILERITTAPGDISAWSPETQVPNVAGPYGATYPNPIYVPSERRLYLYFRGAGFHPTMAYSDDQGGTWAPAREVINPKTNATRGDGGPNRPDRPYAEYAEAANTTYIAFTQAHPQSRPTNIYVVKRVGATFESITGQRQAMPILPSSSNMVFNAAVHHEAAWIWGIAMGSTANPVLVFATFPTANAQDDGYWYARWNPSNHQWYVRELVAGAGGSIDSSGHQPDYAGGIALDPQDPGVLALSRKINGKFMVQLWRTADGGHSWTAATLAQGVRPVFVRGDKNTAKPELLYLSGQYGSYQAFGTSVAYSQMHASRVALPAAG